MKTDLEKSFYAKLLIVIGLTSVIICGLVYLIASGGFNAIHQTATNGTASPVTTKDPNTTNHPTASPSTSNTPIDSPTPSSEPTASPEITTVDTTSTTSIQKIVTRTDRIEASYVPLNLKEPNVNTNHEQLLREEASIAIEKMFNAAKAEGIDLYLISGYRSYETQTSLYYTYLEKYGEDFADNNDDIAGASEHQLGLAADLGDTSHACELQTCFQSSKAYEWLINHSYEYGFILRYPQEKQDVTGVVFSPWHYRYIGVEEATKVHSTNLTLEEYYRDKAVG